MFGPTSAACYLVGMSDNSNPDRHLARLGIRNLTTLPDSVPAAVVLVHNSVRPTRQLGMRGFRAWLQPRGLHLEPCPCDWAPELGEHFRIRREGE